MAKKIYDLLPGLKDAFGRSGRTPAGSLNGASGFLSQVHCNRRVYFLAPLAGVSDHPFRRICQEWGADLTYVEMLSATALLYNNARTLDMAVRHRSEPLLGVQVTGKTPDELARAVEKLDKGPYDTIDINMGCPVQKVVGQGCGSAILKNPEVMVEMIRLAKAATDKPLSVKIRLGWDRTHQDQGREPPLMELLEAVEAGKAAWVTIHGRYRSDDYSVPVDLHALARAKARLGIPVIGNGNIFSSDDAHLVEQETGVDGLMVSRGALGQPWIFQELLDGSPVRLSLEDWRSTVLRHLSYQKTAYGDTLQSAVVMRKHLLWYAAGWPGARRLRESLAKVSALSEAETLISKLADDLQKEGHLWRDVQGEADKSRRFVGFQKPSLEQSSSQGTDNRSLDLEGARRNAEWDPKWDMDRKLDRGVGALSDLSPSVASHSM